jgi:hypothetical protein
MAKGFKYGSGGVIKIGEDVLNFSVVGGTTEPETPAENMIWVNTEAEITSWAFSVTEPTEPTEGMVWIATSEASAAAFNALKKNIIQIFPAGAQMYLNGAWEVTEAKIYKNGAWQEMIFKLVVFNNGEIAEEAGSFKNVSVCRIENGQIIGNNDFTNGTHWCFSKMIDVTRYNTLIVNFVSQSDNTNAIGLRTTMPGSGNVGNQVPQFAAYGDATDVGELRVDISSLSGEYYIAYSGFGFAIDYIELSS